MSCIQILEYHVYSQDAYKVSDFNKHSSLVTAEGETLTVSSLAVLHLCVWRNSTAKPLQSYS